MVLSIFCQIIYFVTCEKIKKTKKTNINTSGAPHKTLMAHCDNHTNGASPTGALLNAKAHGYIWPPGRHSNGALKAILMAHYAVRH